MNRTLLALAAATCLATGLPATALAQSINERQATLESRIENGLRNRTLTDREAAQLRSEFQGIARLEDQYRRSDGGLSASERADLDYRFDLLSRRIQYERSDNQGRDSDGRDWRNINQRQAELDARIDAGVRNNSLTRAEAARLRAEFQDIARQEAQYRANGRGLTAAERAELDRRFDTLERSIRADRRDDDRRWTNLDRRQAQFEQRLNQAVRERRITSREAVSLRSEFRTIARLERRYRRSGGGITESERAELNARFNRMESNYQAAARNSNPFDSLFESLFGIASR